MYRLGPKQRFPEALYLDLLDHALYLELPARPEFSQAAPLNVAEVARDVGVDGKTAAGYFDLLEALLIAARGRSSPGGRSAA